MLQRIEMRPGYDAGAVERTIRINMSRELPRVRRGNGDQGAISICGNGPSLRAAPTFINPLTVACNGAWKELAKAGTIPDFIIFADPSEENIAWTESAPIEPVYLVASRVSPKVFQALSGRKVFIFHLAGDEEIRCGCPEPLIGGGSTIALKAARLLSYMGFSHFDFYGVDSCFALDGADHAAAQAWNGDQEKIPVQIGDKMFLSCPWMIAQAQESLDQFQADKRLYTVAAHGDGLFPAYLDHHTLDVVYDLNSAPASYDFVSWMMNMEMHRIQAGYARLRVRFKAGEQDGFRPNDPIYVEPQKRRDLLANVCRPALSLFGAEEGGTKENGASVPYVIFPTSDAFRSGRALPKMYPSESAIRWAKILVGEEAPITITLRELSAYWPERNSAIEAWTNFAQSLKSRVIFIRDTALADEPIDGFEICPDASRDLHKRFALYRHAKMNFFVSNGPCVMATYTQDVPYICFMKSPSGYPCHRPDWIEKYMGIRYGGQFPWAAKNQRLIWAEDTLENIEGAWRIHEQ